MRVGISEALDRALNPQSIAVVGASDDPNKLGSRPMALLRLHQFAGAVIPVNPSKSTVMESTSYPSVSAIGHPVDLVLVMTPAGAVEATVDDALKAGAKAFVVFASGFAEQDAEGIALQERIKRKLDAAGAIMIGPNCVGIMNAHNRLCATIASIGQVMEFRRGPVSLVSQSGAIGGYWLDKVIRSGIGFSKWITSGNEANVSMADCVTFLADDPETKVITLYLEAIRQPVQLREALRHAASKAKPVLALRAGRSSAGAEAVASHTAAIAGGNEASAAFLRQYGVIEVSSLTEMVDTLKLLTSGTIAAVRRPAVISVSGGAGALVTDSLSEIGLAITHPDEATGGKLADVMPSFVKPRMPLDLTGTVGVDPYLLGRVLKPIAASGLYDAIVIFIGLMHGTADGLCESIIGVTDEAPSRVIVVWISAPPRALETLQARGIPVFEDIPNAMRALQALNRSSEFLAAPWPDPPYAVKARRPGEPKPLSEAQGQAVLGTDFPLSLPAGALVKPGDSLDAELSALQFPLVAKLQSGELLHKTEHGAILLNLKTPKEATDAVTRLLAIGEKLGIPVDGVLLQEMIAHDHEMIIGLRLDVTLGPMLLIGKGGTEVEFEQDTMIGFLPLAPDQIEAAIGNLKMAHRLRGSRGRAGVDISKLAEQVSALCRFFASRDDIAEIEVNPAAIDKQGQMVALDLIVRKSPEEAA